MRDQIDSLLQQEMDRKNFLKYGGTIVLAVLGVTGLLRILLSSKEVATSVTTVQEKPASISPSRYGR